MRDFYFWVQKTALYEFVRMRIQANSFMEAVDQLPRCFRWYQAR